MIKEELEFFKEEVSPQKRRLWTEIKNEAQGLNYYSDKDEKTLYTVFNEAWNSLEEPRTLEKIKRKMNL